MAKFAQLVKKKERKQFIAANSSRNFHKHAPNAQHKDNHVDNMISVHQQLLKTKTGSGRESKVASMLQSPGHAAGKWWTEADTAVFGPAHGSRVSVLGREVSSVGLKPQGSTKSMDGIIEEEDGTEGEESYVTMEDDSDEERRECIHKLKFREKPKASTHPRLPPPTFSLSFQTPRILISSATTSPL